MNFAVRFKYNIKCNNNSIKNGTISVDPRVSKLLFLWGVDYIPKLGEWLKWIKSIATRVIIVQGSLKLYLLYKIKNNDN
jgi:hypothetical protein